MQVMLVADDQDEKETFAYIIRREGLAIASSSDLQRVLKSWTDHPADILVVALTKNDEVIEDVEAVRTITQIPLLMIIDPSSEMTFCELLQKGADVVLNRPVSPKVFTAQMGALIRRSAAVPTFVLPTLTLDTIVLDPSTRTVIVRGEEPRRLTQLEFRLLYTLMTNRGQVLPVEVIVERVWGYSGEGNQDLVRGLISRLRRKIEPDPNSNHFIETIAGVGYRFKVDEI
jgi:DNA-binding response OmpR family regulator